MIRQALAALIPWQLGRPCSTEYAASYHGPPRSLSSIRYLVLHTTEDANLPTKPSDARGSARYFSEPHTPTSGPGGSAQLVVGDLDCYRCVPDGVTPYAAPPLNENGLHIEHAGSRSWSRARWLTFHRLELRRSAKKAARMLSRPDVNVPAYLLDAAALRARGPNPPAGKGGITTHAAVSAAFHETDHTDPGPGFPLDVWLKYLNGYLKGV